MLSKIKNVNWRWLLRIIKATLLVSAGLSAVIILLLILWYSLCFFPDDQDYLLEISDSVKYRGDHLEEVEVDLVKEINDAAINPPIDQDDRNFLLSEGLKERDFYIDKNPYGRPHNNNLKYATGKIFYYVYQKNSIVLKSRSSISYAIKNRGKRFLEFDAAFPALHGETGKSGTIRVYYTNVKRRLIYKKNIDREKKPDIKPFRYSSIFSSLFFYLKHPGRSVLTDYTGWEKIRMELPREAGRLEIEFESGGEKDFLFIGSPAVYSVKDKKRDDHVNVVYLIFDTLAKEHIDLYEYYDEFMNSPPEEVMRKFGERKILTPAINRFARRICLLENMNSAGQTTRPSIVALWTSRNYTECRMPVFRNIVTEDNKNKFYEQGFTTLGKELSDRGYFTKQICCNAQGHGVSGVGADLGFDENYDYTMETSELTENFRRILEFLDENQNRKFFLYAHINTPHTPMWIPLNYFISAYIESGFRTKTARVLGNIRYLNDSLDKIMNAIEKLDLLKNTVVIITADHSKNRTPYLRGELTADYKISRQRESQRVASFHKGAIYTRSGRQHLLQDYMNVPWILIAPPGRGFIPGKIDAYISTLDVSPSLLDITTGKKAKAFSGRSFKDLLLKKDNRDKTFTGFIPLVGRFQRGFILDGRYKYYINLPGLYKYEIRNGLKYITRQEYLFDLKKDPLEVNNLARGIENNSLLNELRQTCFNRFTDFPDKNFVQIIPLASKGDTTYTIHIKSNNGKIIYPQIFGENATFSQSRGRESSGIFKCTVAGERALFSFETDPPDAALSIHIFENGKPVSRDRIFSSVECINFFDNPVIIRGRTDRHIAREPGKTGLEEKDLPPGSVYYSRIPLNYWMEMNLSDSDIKLSPGIKEVLRGWGYIQ